MNKFFLFSTLKSKLLLFFLFVITSVIILTLFFVQQAIYNHSTEQLHNQSKKTASVVTNTLENRSELLRRTAENLAGNFTVKQYIASASDDSESLAVAMRNYQQRIKADLFFVLDSELQLVSSSLPISLDPSFVPVSYTSSGISWLNNAGQTLLVKGSAVRYIEKSRSIDAWIFFGYFTTSLINEQISTLTDMKVSLMKPHTNQVLGSTLAIAPVQVKMNNGLLFDNDLHELEFNQQTYIYTTAPFGSVAGQPVYLFLAKEKNKAYLSYQSMLGQLIFLLVAAAALALFVAGMLSHSISSPLKKLAAAALLIQKGQEVHAFPHSSTREVDSLSGALQNMQTGIKDREQQIQQLAYYDDLTALPNRNHYLQKISTLIDSQNTSNVGVWMLDVDRFKEINDTIGHDKGDELLIKIAQRLQQITHHHYFLARIGGDEFGLVAPCDNLQVLEEYTKQIVTAFNTPFALAGLIMDVDCSIGAALYPAHANNLQAIVQCADIAMYKCKSSHNDYAIFDPSMNKYSIQRLNLMSELKNAIQAGELQFYYQPKQQLDDGSIASVECLVRWIHPVHGFVPPDDFIPLAEQTGAIKHVTNWGLKKALEQQKQWRQEGLTIAVAVNISAIDLVDMTLPVLVSELLQQFDGDPALLTIEVTESAIMADPGNALKALSALKRMGVKLSIDDFGTGYSSMAQLKDIPVHELKIDKAFVLSLASSTDDQAIVKTIISLAKNLNLDIVAEGVEDETSMQMLRQMGCTRAQGYFIAKPLPEEQFSVWIQTQKKHSRCCA